MIWVGQVEMGNVHLGLSNGSLPLVVAGVIVTVVLLSWIIVLHRRNRRLEARFNELFGDMTNDNMGQMLAEYLNTVRTTAGSVNRMKAEHDRMAAIMPSVIRHVGLVRFSPFHDTGGDQSFALALLNGQGDGVIVTALHSRSDSRLYAKPVEGGRSQYSLSPEEREAMDRALQRQTVEASAS